MFNKKGKSTVSSAKLFSASRHKRLVKHVFIRYNKYCTFSGNDYPLLCILREFYPFVLYTLFLLASRAFRQIQNKNLIGGLHLANRLAFVDGSLTLAKARSLLILDQRKGFVVMILHKTC